MSQFHVKPTAGRKVREPATGEVLPPEGALKPKSQYWMRRVRDGDVVMTEAKRSRKE